jgi:hypothetical protein
MKWLSTLFSFLSLTRDGPYSSRLVPWLKGPAAFFPAALLAALLTEVVLGAPPQPLPVYSQVTAITVAPTLLDPTAGETVPSFGPTLSWQNPTGTTQIHLQVIPINGDGPGADVRISTAATTFAVPPPPRWFGLLPDMTYTWRVRASDASGTAALDDTSWGPWASAPFRTPVLNSSTISLTAPAPGSQVTSLMPTLVWANTNTNGYYYEVQISKDSTFNTDPAIATAMVYWELRHGGVTNPPNSYTVPNAWPLEPNTTYYWRVRPRVQGDGTPVAWSSSSNFRTGAPSTATPAATSTATATPTVTGTPATATATPTATGTPATATPTPTATGTPATATATPTATGTPATATATRTATGTPATATATRTATGTPATSTATTTPMP